MIVKQIRKIDLRVNLNILSCKSGLKLSRSDKNNGFEE